MQKVFLFALRYTLITHSPFPTELRIDLFTFKVRKVDNKVFYKGKNFNCSHFICKSSHLIFFFCNMGLITGPISKGIL